MLWCRLVATAPIRSLAWEPPHASGAALRRPKKKKKKKSQKKNKGQISCDERGVGQQWGRGKIIVVENVCQSQEVQLNRVFSFKIPGSQGEKEN